MALVRSLLRPMQRQLRRQVEDASMPRLDALSAQIEEVRRVAVEVQRIVTDDLDASNETAALLGRALAGLTDSVAELRAEVAELRSRLG